MKARDFNCSASVCKSLPVRSGNLCQDRDANQWRSKQNSIHQCLMGFFLSSWQSARLLQHGEKSKEANTIKPLCSGSLSCQVLSKSIFYNKTFWKNTRGLEKLNHCIFNSFLVSVGTCQQTESAVSNICHSVQYNGKNVADCSAPIYFNTSVCALCHLRSDCSSCRTVLCSKQKYETEITKCIFGCKRSANCTHLPSCWIEVFCWLIINVILSVSMTRYTQDSYLKCKLHFHNIHFDTNGTLISTHNKALKYENAPCVC